MTMVSVQNCQPIMLKVYIRFCLSFCYDNVLLNMQDGVSCIHDYGCLGIIYKFFYSFYPNVIFDQTRQVYNGPQVVKFISAIRK